MRALGADVADLKHPLAGEIALNGEVPLLRVRNDEWRGTSSTNKFCVEFTPGPPVQA